MHWLCLKYYCLLVRLTLFNMFDNAKTHALRMHARTAHTPPVVAGHKQSVFNIASQGGDLMRAINNDHSNELRWSRKGGLLMLDIARGLTFLHANKVCCPHLFLPPCLIHRDTIIGIYNHCLV